MRTETRFIPVKQMRIGDKFKRYRRGDCTTSSFCKWTIKSDPTKAFITVQSELGEQENWETENLLIEVSIPEVELEQKYKSAAREVQEALHNELAIYECGEHEMWNAWLSFDAYEVAQAVSKEQFKVIGVCYDESMRKYGRFFEFDPEWNCAVVIEYPNGDRYWCHWSSEYVNEMKEQDLS